MPLALEQLETRDTPAAVPVELLQQYSADVRALSEGASRPSDASVQVFVMTTLSAFSDGVLSQSEAAQIVQAGRVVQAEGNVPSERLLAVVIDAQLIASSLGLRPAAPAPRCGCGK